MEIRGWKIDRVIIAFLVVASLLFGGEKLLEYQRVENPVLSGVKNIPGVVEARLVNTSNGMTLEVKLQGVTDLAKTYQAIQDKVEPLGNRLTSVDIRDSRTQELSDALHDLHFAIQEGIATGHFQNMADQVQALAQKSGVKISYLTVTGDGVYVTLAEKGHYLYAIYPRPETVAGQANQTGGGKG